MSEITLSNSKTHPNDQRKTNMDINVNSNWKSNGSGSIINVDFVDDKNVTLHMVEQGDGSAPEENQWKQVTMPISVFIVYFSFWID